MAYKQLGKVSKTYDTEIIDMFDVPERLIEFAQLPLTDCVQEGNLGSSFAMGSKIFSTHESISRDQLKQCKNRLKAMQNGVQVKLNAYAKSKLDPLISELEVSLYYEQTFVEGKENDQALAQQLKHIVHLCLKLGATTEAVNCKKCTKRLLRTHT